ncbi:unnamed protein product [Ilex paraguariensis]|uniref:Uncharacterized protein n=1 Tax=Ilex paraguariensis TaxID=185542 RepID=A0ABC8R553_9AQUA
MKKQNEEPSEFDDDWTKNLDQLRLKFGDIAELKEQLYKLRRELKSDQESVALELNHQIELQTRVTGNKKMVKAKYLQLILELAAQQLSTFDAQLEIFDRAQVSISDLLKEPVDQELRDETDSDIEIRMQNTKAKKESTLSYQIGGGAEDSKKTTEKDELKLIRSTIAGVTGDFSAVGRQTRPELGYKV